MFRNHLLSNGLIVLTLVAAGPNIGYCAPAPASVPSPPSQAAQKKAVPEDPGQWRREPFKILEGPKQAASLVPPGQLAHLQPDLLLQGIMKSGTHYYAIVNGRTVRPGDRIEGWTVAAISRYQAVFRRDKEKAVYDIYQGKIDRGNR